MISFLRLTEGGKKENIAEEAGWDLWRRSSQDHRLCRNGEDIDMIKQRATNMLVASA